MNTLILIVLVLLGIPALVYLMWGVHCGLDRICVGHARRFCRRNGLKIDRARWKPAIEPSGVKTEFTLVQLECRDRDQQRRLVQLLVWPLGVRKLLSDATYIESVDEDRPQQNQG